MKSYDFVHPEGWKSDERLYHWLGLALGFNPRAKSSKR
jgi:hypothetical protein